MSNSTNYSQCLPKELQNIVIEYVKTQNYKFEIFYKYDKYPFVKLVSENSFNMILSSFENIEAYLIRIDVCLRTLEIKDLEETYFSFLNIGFGFEDNPKRCDVFINNTIIDGDNYDNFEEIPCLTLNNFTFETLKRILKKLYYDFVKIYLQERLEFSQTTVHTFLSDDPLIQGINLRNTRKVFRKFYDYINKTYYNDKEFDVLISVKFKDEVIYYKGTKKLFDENNNFQSYLSKYEN